MSLDAALSDHEIDELDAFLLSDATPDDCMDIVTLDGFLTALVIGTGLVPPSVWLPLVWGGSAEPTFKSSAQAQGVFTLMMRRFEAISGALALDPPEFEPILQMRSVAGAEVWSAEDWCWGFMAGVRLALKHWQPLLDDPDGRALLLPIVTLGSEEGWKLLEADADPDAAEQAALDELALSVVPISRYWRRHRQELGGVLRQASIRPKSQRVGRNDPSPCGSGRKYKRCCLNAAG
ncbi:MAG: UPF0149 family protein [Candidatus Binataceae bacterium]|jgi:uncharacterized protein